MKCEATVPDFDRITPPTGVTGPKIKGFDDISDAKLIAILFQKDRHMDVSKEDKDKAE